MNWSKISTSSLFQLVQEIPASPQPMAVNGTTLDSLASAMVDILREKRLNAQIWLKSPQPQWCSELGQYQQHRVTPKVYLFSTEDEDDGVATSGSLASRRKAISRKDADFTNIKLHKGCLPHQEAFLITISPQFCSVIIAQPHTHRQGRGKVKTAWKIIFSCEQVVVEAVIKTVKHSIIIGDDTPADLLTSSNLPSPFPTLVDANLLTNLLLKQTQRHEMFSQTSIASSSVSSQLRRKETLEIKQFINQVVHELRTPLTHMKTALSILESSKLKPTQRQRYLQMLHVQWEHQNSLVSGLLDLMELESASMASSISPLHLEEFIPGIVSTYQPIAMEKGVQLGYTIPSGIPPVSFPSNELRRVVINLLNNSLKYTNPSGKVSVQASLKEGYVQLAFIDTGVGIAPIDLRKIFDSFYRGRSTPSENTAGAGLGLTIVQQILQRYGGSISVTSQQRKGSTFKVLLPVA